MENNAHVFKIMIASPGDAKKQRQEIKNIIYDLNTCFSKQNVYIFPYMWEKDVAPGFYTDDIQNTIDKIITENSDMIIGIFKGTIGRVYEKAGASRYSHLVSYTVEEIKEHVERGKSGVIIFIEPDPAVYSEKEIEKVHQLRAHLDEIIGIHVLDLKFDNEEDFSGKISDRIRQAIDEMIKRENNTNQEFRKNVKNNLTYFENMDFSNPLSDSDNLKTFQTIPYFSGGTLKNEIRKVIDYSFPKLQECYSADQGYWTNPADDTDFNRNYYTSSVLTYFFQLGINQDSELVKKPLEYLKQCDPADINPRAGTFFLLAFHLLSQYDARTFIQTLVKFDAKKRGIILLPQEDIKSKADENHWVGQRHVDGASFHACHISDHLLHMDTSFTEAMATAQPLLFSLRHYIIEEFEHNNGFLTSLDREPSTITLYGYAISAALGIELPPNWLENVKECKRMLLYETKDDFKRCMGVIDFAYMSRMSDNPELRIIANDYIKVELEYLWNKRDRICTNANNIAVWARAFLYGHNLLSSSSSYYYRDLSRTWETMHDK